MKQWVHVCSVASLLLVAAPAKLQAAPVEASDEADLTAPDATQEKVVVYPAAFFARYRPNTALDMVQEVPGFQLDNGDSSRGFGSAAGNILIEDRRPSVKQDEPSDILSRIPASHVRRIELIRGQVEGIELQGQGIVANVILRDRTPPKVRWEGYLRYNLDFGFTPEYQVSLSDRWNGIQYNAGISGRRYRTGDLGTVRVFDADGDLTELRFDEIEGSGHNTSGSLNASTWWGENLIRANANFSHGTMGDDFVTSRRISPQQDNAEHLELFHEAPRTTRFEVGTDVERLLRPDLLGRAIFLYSHEDNDDTSSHWIMGAAGDQVLFRLAETDTLSTEGIARLELNWVGWPGHIVQFNLERSRNVLENELVQTVDTGSGPVPVDVPDANSRVQEVRWDFLLKDTWSRGPFDFSYGLGGEVSTISQTGDSNLERSFEFLKPQVLLTYSPMQRQQTRLRVAREVAQLNFRDFVSATLFQDDDLALGNPDLRPETTWIAELSHERRFGDLGVVTLTGFHHWISDVEDLLPLTSVFEAPGNIGDGSRWGVRLESTVPLDWLSLDAARLDVRVRWQQSAVEDPVTGNERALSGPGGDSGSIPYTEEDNEYALSIDYRQDFDDARVAWGWGLVTRAERPLFKVNELAVYDEEAVDVGVFVETKRWLGLTIRLEGNNLLDFERTRERTVYLRRRALSPLDFRETRSRARARRVVLVVSGDF